MASDESNDLNVDAIEEEMEKQSGRKVNQGNENLDNEKENNNESQESSVDNATLPNNNNQVYDIEIEDIPQEKQDEWIKQLIFKDKVVDERTMADGDITVKLSISTGEGTVNAFDTVKDYIDEYTDKEEEDYTNSEIQTLISVSHCAQILEEINDEKPGGENIMKRFMWLNKKPVLFVNKILQEYQKFEYELNLVLSEGEDIKNK